MKNYYEVLEVSQNASQEVIEKAYKALAKKYHPDRWPKDKQLYANNKLEELVEAYSVLSNVKLRQEYNQLLKINIHNTAQKNNFRNQENNKNISQKNSLFSFKNFKPNGALGMPTKADIKTSFKTFIKNESKKSKEEHLTDIKVLLLTIIIVVIIIILFLKIPFLRKLVTSFP